MDSRFLFCASQTASSSSDSSNHHGPHPQHTSGAAQTHDGSPTTIYIDDIATQRPAAMLMPLAKLAPAPSATLLEGHFQAMQPIPRDEVVAQLSLYSSLPKEQHDVSQMLLQQPPQRWRRDGDGASHGRLSSPSYTPRQAAVGVSTCSSNGTTGSRMVDFISPAASSDSLWRSGSFVSMPPPPPPPHQVGHRETNLLSSHFDPASPLYPPLPSAETSIIGTPSTTPRGAVDAAVAAVPSTTTGVTASAATTATTTPSSAAVATSHYKTKSCRHFDQTSWCPYQHRCVFAHGARELDYYSANRSNFVMTPAQVTEYINQNVTVLVEEYERALRENAGSTAAPVQRGPGHRSAAAEKGASHKGSRAPPTAPPSATPSMGLTAPRGAAAAAAAVGMAPSCLETKGMEAPAIVYPSCQGVVRQPAAVLMQQQQHHFPVYTAPPTTAVVSPPHQQVPGHNLSFGALSPLSAAMSANSSHTCAPTATTLVSSNSSFGGYPNGTIFVTTTPPSGSLYHHQHHPPPQQLPRGCATTVGGPSSMIASPLTHGVVNQQPVYFVVYPSVQNDSVLR